MKVLQCRYLVLCYSTVSVHEGSGQWSSMSKEPKIKVLLLLRFLCFTTVQNYEIHPFLVKYPTVHHRCRCRSLVMMLSGDGPSFYFPRSRLSLVAR